MKSLREYLDIIEKINESAMPMVGGVEFAEDDLDAVSLADADVIGGDATDNLIADVDTDERKIQEEEKSQAEQLESIILHRIMMQHPGLLQQFGPEAVMDAARDTAESYGDYDELGTRDISNLVNSVARSLGHESEQLDELSPSTLSSYAKKASKQAVGKVHQFRNEFDPAKKIAHIDKSVKRTQGVDRAVDKLASKAAPEQDPIKKIDELFKNS